jgi:hypothetical protein
MPIGAARDHGVAVVRAVRYGTVSVGATLRHAVEALSASAGGALRESCTATPIFECVDDAVAVARSIGRRRLPMLCESHTVAMMVVRRGTAGTVGEGVGEPGD